MTSSQNRGARAEPLSARGSEPTPSHRTRSLRPWLGLLLLLALLTAPPAAGASSGPEVEAVREALYGALLTLADTQVLDREGRRPCRWDASDLGDGCRSQLGLTHPRSLRASYFPLGGSLAISNQVGEWGSIYMPLPTLLPPRRSWMFSVPDSNLFIPGMVLYSLLRVYGHGQESRTRALVAAMLRAAEGLEAAYARGGALAFWGPDPGAPQQIAPPNTPIGLVRRLAQLYAKHGDSWLARRLIGERRLPSSPAWIEACLSLEQNPSGAGALFNIPADADDSALTVANQILMVRNDLSKQEATSPIPELILRHRDLGPRPPVEDPRESWPKQPTGAYLTWLVDDWQPTFGHPSSGVIPLGRNFVDPVVNANVLLMFGLLEQAQAPGVDRAVALLNQLMEGPEGLRSSLYYPEEMMVAYAISRAFREGGHPGLKPATQHALRRALEGQATLAGGEPRNRGAFPSVLDPRPDFATALGAITLLNAGPEVARGAGISEAAYWRSLDEAIAYLLRAKKPHRLKNPETARWRRSRDEAAYRWLPGLAFSATYWDGAHWRSEAVTTALVAEALAKYLAQRGETY